MEVKLLSFIGHYDCKNDIDKALFPVLFCEVMEYFTTKLIYMSLSGLTQSIIIFFVIITWVDDNNYFNYEWSHKMPLWVLLLFIFVAYFIWYTCKNFRNIKFCKYQNGPKPFPFIGNLDVLYNTNIFECLTELKKKYSMPFNIWIWSDYYYITDIPREIKALLCNSSKSFNKAPFYDDLIRIIFGDTFIMTPITEINKWRLERNVAAKAFSPSMWSYYTPVFHKKSKKLSIELININSFNSLFEMLTDIVFEVFMENFMDIKMEHSAEHGKLVLALNELLDMLSHRSTFSRLVPHWFWKYVTKEGRKFDQLVKYLRKNINRLIEEKRRIFLQNNVHGDNPHKPKLIELLLLKEDTKFTTDIYKQIFLMYFTSIETSALTLSYTLVHLGMHPEVQEKVLQEILQHVGYREIVPEDLSKLKYLEQTILETIRILPVVPISGRHITEDIDLDNKIIPKGANAAIIPYMVHRNEKYWPSPEKFDPDRFSSENVKNIEVGSYIPFLLGTRDCIGKYYSVAQVKIFTANILRNYKINVNPKEADNLKFSYYIVLKPIHDFDIKFERKNID